MENGKTLIGALVALLPVALWGATGIGLGKPQPPQNYNEGACRFR